MRGLVEGNALVAALDCYDQSWVSEGGNLLGVARRQGALKEARKRLAAVSDQDPTILLAKLEEVVREAQRLKGTWISAMNLLCSQLMMFAFVRRCLALDMSAKEDIIIIGLFWDCDEIFGYLKEKLID